MKSQMLLMSTWNKSETQLKPYYFWSLISNRYKSSHSTSTHEQSTCSITVSKFTTLKLKKSTISLVTGSWLLLKILLTMWKFLLKNHKFSVWLVKSITRIIKLSRIILKLQWSLMCQLASSEISSSGTRLLIMKIVNLLLSIWFISMIRKNQV